MSTVAPFTEAARESAAKRADALCDLEGSRPFGELPHRTVGKSDFDHKKFIKLSFRGLRRFHNYETEYASGLPGVYRFSLPAAALCVLPCLCPSCFRPVFLRPVFLRPPALQSPRFGRRVPGLCLSGSCFFGRLFPGSRILPAAFTASCPRRPSRIIAAPAPGYPASTVSSPDASFQNSVSPKSNRRAMLLRAIPIWPRTRPRRGSSAAHN